MILSRWRDTFGGQDGRTPKTIGRHVISAEIRAAHRHQIIFPRTGRIGGGSIGAIRTLPIATDTANSLSGTNESTSTNLTKSGKNSTETKTYPAALAVPMGSVDLGGEVAKPAADAADIHVQYADTGIGTLGVGVDWRWG
jgi:hypothetical protein